MTGPADGGLDELRHEIAAARGLGADAVPLLGGQTIEEIEARADALVTLVAAHGREPAREETVPGLRPQPRDAGGRWERRASFDGGARETAPEKQSPEEEHNDFLLRALSDRRADAGLHF